METPQRFPQRLGNLAQNPRFPHSHKPTLVMVIEQDRRTETHAAQPTCPPNRIKSTGPIRLRVLSDATSSFSIDAKQYAERIDTRIMLIDGMELARMVIAHGVGVTPAAVYELKRVDSDFSSEE